MAINMLSCFPDSDTLDYFAEEKIADEKSFSLISNTLLMRASKGARGKAETKRVTKPY
jgi:hypothetical protein